MQENEEITPEAAAGILGISLPLVYHRMDTGRLPFRQVGTDRRVLLIDVQALLSFEDARQQASRELAEDTDDQEI